MIKGLAITPPVLGRISIGKVVEKNGKRLPAELFKLVVAFIFHAADFSRGISTSRSGFSQTRFSNSQLRVAPLQRIGCRAFAAV